MHISTAPWEKHSGKWSPMPILSNPRHEQFAQGLATGKSATEAYKDAGYKGDRTAACRLAANVNVKARVQELQAVAAERTKVTITSLIQEAEEVRGLAVSERQLSAANTAIVTKAKLSGLWVDRSEVGELDLGRMSWEEIKDYLRQRYGEERGNKLIDWLETAPKFNVEVRHPQSPMIYSQPIVKNRLPRPIRRR
jgi:Terminase small subunit